jgi:hypothetical protein
MRRGWLQIAGESAQPVLHPQHSGNVSAITSRNTSASNGLCKNRLAPRRKASSSTSLAIDKKIIQPAHNDFRRMVGCTRCVLSRSSTLIFIENAKAPKTMATIAKKTNGRSPIFVRGCLRFALRISREVCCCTFIATLYQTSSRSSGRATRV